MTVGDTAATPPLPASGAASRRPRLESISPGMRLPIFISLLPGILLFAVFFLIPLAIVFSTAFFDWSLARLSFVGIENFTSLFGQPRFWKVVGNTVAYAAASVLFQVPLALLVAIILSGPIRGRNTIRAILYLPNMISGAALGVVFALVYNPRFGLLNRLLDGLGLESLSQDWLFTVSTAWWAVTATFVFLIGFFVILLMTEIVSLPAEVMEAATIDGASSVQRHLHVTLPLLRNIIGTCVLLSLLGSLAFFDTVFVMTGGGPGDATATISLYGYREYLNGDWGSANAVGVFIVIAGGALILSVRRLFRIGERD